MSKEQERLDDIYDRAHDKGRNRKLSPTIHNQPEFKELRKRFQGINATTKGSIEKSKRRHSKHQALKHKIKNSKMSTEEDQDLLYGNR